MYEPLAQRWQLAGAANLPEFEPHIPSADEMARLSKSLEGERERVSDIDQRMKRLRQRKSELEHSEYQVAALSELGIDVAALSDLRFLHLRAGTLPAENVDRVCESAALGEDLVLRFGTRDGRAHVLVVGAGGISPDLEGLLAKAHFVPFELPAAISSGDVEVMIPQLHTEAVAVQAELEDLERQDRELLDSARGPLLEAARMLGLATVFVECEGAMEGRAPVAFLSGWAAWERLTELEQRLARDVVNPVVLVHEPVIRPGRLETCPTGQQPPTELAVPAIFRPGAALVSLYGTPSYDELNPTLVLAATTPLFFGMMFGDVGQGLLMAVLAIACRRWLGRWVAPALSCSFGCIVFGLLYGSVFGIEQWLPALWLRPMAQPFR
ncbi:MAG: hypothetical protein HY000_36190, partial [Planctomycetes bacterium]|nr:hypothetical protein [Planctomycetota bacterium]